MKNACMLCVNVQQILHFDKCTMFHLCDETWDTIQQFRDAKNVLSEKKCNASERSPDFEWFYEETGQKQPG
jgi:hypothetical protein